MLKRVTILLTFLAYSLSLAHSLVPHHHHDEKVLHQHKTHHDFDHEDSHDEDHSGLSEALSKFVHNPSGEFFAHNSTSEQKLKTSSVLQLTHTYTLSLTVSDSKPHGYSHEQQKHYDSNLLRISLLRAPPALV